jgi:hypothetical protein
MFLYIYIETFDNFGTVFLYKMQYRISNFCWKKEKNEKN